MKCSDIRDKLMDYVAEELPPAEMEEVCSHITTCEGCRAQLAVARKVSDALLLLSAEEPVPDLVGAVRRRLDQPQRSWAFLTPRLAWAFTAVLVCMLVITGWLVWRPGTQPNSNTAHQPRKPQTPAIANKAVQPPVEIHTAKAPQPVKHRPVLRYVAIRQPQPKPQTKHAVAVRPKPERRVKPMPEVNEPAPRPEEPEIRMAVSPREPESFVIQVGDEEPSTSAELTVIRHFDVGGNVKAVTITNKPQPADNHRPDSVNPGNTLLLDVQPKGSVELATTRFGGNITNA